MKENNREVDFIVQIIMLHGSDSYFMKFLWYEIGEAFVAYGCGVWTTSSILSYYRFFM